MTVKQISAFLENKPGSLASFTTILQNSGIDLRALSLAETEDFGIVRIIVNDPEKAILILKQEGYVCSVTRVLAVVFEDKPGALVNVLNLLGGNDINLEYMYAILSAEGSNAYMIFKVADDAKATAALVSNGIKVLSQEDMAEL